jgi:hypothetical protein
MNTLAAIDVSYPGLLYSPDICLTRRYEDRGTSIGSILPEVGLTLLGFEKSEQGWLVHAEGRTGSECPACGTESTARHSRYWRQLQDLPVQGNRSTMISSSA